MDAEQPVKRDERTAAVENAAFKWAYNLLFFGLLLDWLCRYQIWNERAWDLVALLCISVAIITVYLIRHEAAGLLSWKKLVVVYAIWGLVAFIIHIFGTLFHNQ
jgi:hypothetical protein